MTPLDLVISRLGKTRKNGNEYYARCPGPSHKRGDRNPSLCISENAEGAVLIKCQKTGCKTEEVVAAMGLEMKDLFADSKPLKVDPVYYVYINENGEPAHRVKRRPGGGFPQYRPDGNGGWIDGIKGVELVPYRLPGVIKAVAADEPVFIVEGEKDADRLTSLGLTATTNSGGAGNWTPAHSQHLAGAKAIIIPDFDEAGYLHLQKTGDSLIAMGNPAVIKIVALPGLSDKGDVSDWLDAGHTKEELVELAKQAESISTIEDLESFVNVNSPSNEKLTTLGEPLCGVPLTEQEWLIDGFLVEGAINSIYADGGKGKSYLAMYIAVCIALGRPFLGRDVPQGRVFYLDFELSRSVQVRRLAAICRGFGVELETLGDSLMYFGPGSEEANDNDPSTFNEVMPRINPSDFKLIIIDSVGVAMAGDSLSAQEVCAWFQQLRKLGSCLVLDHHSKLTQGQKVADKPEFGSVYKRNLSRNVWQLNCSDDGIRSVLENQKANLTEKQQPFAFEVTRNADTYKIASTDLSSEFSDHLSVKKRIVLALEEEGRRTTKEVAADLEMTVDRVKPVMSLLKDDGRVVQVGKQGKAALWNVVKKVDLPEGSGEKEGDPPIIKPPARSNSANTPIEQEKGNVVNNSLLTTLTINETDSVMVEGDDDLDGFVEVPT